MNYLNSNIAREAGRLHHWREKFWGRRYRSIPVLDDEAIEARLRYLLDHGCKEGLVERPVEWPGPSCLPALLHGQVLRGLWFDRTAEYRARRKGETRRPHEFARSYEVPLTPIPNWSHLKPDEQRRRAAELVAGIETAERDSLQADGRVAAGPELVCSQDPHDKPRHSQHSPAPLCHTSSRDMRNAFHEAYASFVELFRNASSQLRANVPNVLFPHHCFPPAHGFYEGFLEPAPS